MKEEGGFLRVHQSSRYSTTSRILLFFESFFLGMANLSGELIEFVRRSYQKTNMEENYVEIESC